MLKRFSWGGLQKRSAQEKEEEEEDVEVVEFFSGATTSDTTEKESRQEVAQPAKKQRTREQASDERREPPRPAKANAKSGQSEYVVAGDVSLLTPPTKRRRMLSQAIPAMETLIDVIADEEEVLSTRLEYCTSLWRFVREMHSDDVVEFVRQRGSSVVRVIEALLHTGYFPLQQLCFMTVAAILYQLHKKDTEALAAFVVACQQYLSEADANLLDLLPLREAIPWHDPRVARQRIVQINRRTGLCSSFRASRCWVSPNGKQELARIRVNKWIDIGSTTTTFYWRDENDVVVVNVPHSCVEDVEVDRENCVLYVWTKHIDRLKGVRLLAFSSIPADFPGLVKALAGVEIEGHVEPSKSPSLNPVDFGSPIQNMKTSSTLVLSGVSPPRSPTTTFDESGSRESHPLEDSAVEQEHLPTGDNEVEQPFGFEQDNGFEPDTADENEFEPDEPDDVDRVDEIDEVHEVHEAHEAQDVHKLGENETTDEVDAVVVDEEATQSQLSEDDDSLSSIEGELDSRLSRASRRTSDSLKSLHKRLDASKEALTDKFSRVSSARLESSDQIADRVYKLRARVDILQKKRLLDLPNAEFIVEENISRAASDANEHLEEALDYASEILMPDEPDLIFTTTSIVMLLIVVIPWVLFAALHSGTDMNSVRQLAGDGMLLLTALLRKFSGSG